MHHCIGSTEPGSNSIMLVYSEGNAIGSSNCFAMTLHLQKYFADKREDKIALIKGITTGEGFPLPPLPQVHTVL